MGKLAAALPDNIDPPTCFRHRSIGHGAAPATAGMAALASSFPRAQQWLHEEAGRHADARSEATTLLSRLLHLIMEYCFRFMAGVVVGAVAGYASHLVLDAGTPLGLPILG
jgi:hypothetical protein